MKKTLQHLLTATAACVMLSVPITSQAQINGAGSSLVRGLVELWSKKIADGKVSYIASGSSAGLKALADNTVDFAITDKPLTGVQLERQSLKQLPLAATAVAVAVNIPGITAATPIKLSGSLLADIYLGVVTNWNNAAIAYLNPSLKLPNLAITPMWRSDGSGSSYAFSTYLARNDPTWRRLYSSTLTINLKIGQGHAGGAALLAAIKATPGAIGYEGMGQISKAGLNMPSLENAMQKFVTPNPASITEALSKAKWDLTASVGLPSNAATMDNAAGDNSWPITAVSYVVFRTTGFDKNPARAFVFNGLDKADNAVMEAGFVSLPAAIRESTRTIILK